MDIKLCPNCGGEGETSENVGTHNNEYEYHRCTTCKGTGRVQSYKRTFELTVPFGADTKLMSEGFNQIFTIFREYEKKLKE